MQIKKYLAPSLKEALDQLKNELGDEAVVLSTRVVNVESKQGAKKQYEVIAGIEIKTAEKSSRPKLVDKIIGDDTEHSENEIKKLQEKVFPALHIEKKQAKQETEKSKPNHITPAKLKKIKECLLLKEVFPSIANKIVEQLSSQAEFVGNGNFENHIISSIASLIHTSDFEVKKKKSTKVVALVGPTGVGKTTCIAKLAVISKIFHKLDIGIISLDTFRLGAIDQLKIFSEISNVDLLVGYEPDDVPKLVNKFRKKDLIFIDTAGRSQNNAASLKEIKKFLSMVQLDELFLVLSSTNSTRNLLDVIKKFQDLNFTGLIFTKLDEAAVYGNILNVTGKIEIPIKFLTNGQVIPDDIIAADAQYIAKIIHTGNSG